MYKQRESVKLVDNDSKIKILQDYEMILSVPQIREGGEFYQNFSQKSVVFTWKKRCLTNYFRTILTDLDFRIF